MFTKKTNHNTSLAPRCVQNTANTKLQETKKLIEIPPYYIDTLDVPSKLHQLLDFKSRLHTALLIVHPSECQSAFEVENL
jgi:hypothetical protein